jgi:hypothetical protein
MAAKKTKTSKNSAKKPTRGSGESAEGVTVMLDTDTILTLKAAVDAMSEFASAVLMASDDPTVRGAAGKSAKKTSKKRAKKSAARKTS